MAEKAGWYNDPEGSGKMRWWTGNQWTETYKRSETDERKELMALAESIIPCNCGDAYLKRNLIAPDCLFHNGAEAILDELLLRGFKVVRSD